MVEVAHRAQGVDGEVLAPAGAVGAGQNGRLADLADLAGLAARFGTPKTKAVPNARL